MFHEKQIDNKSMRECVHLKGKRKQWKPSLTITGERGHRRGAAPKEDVGTSICIWTERCYYRLPIQAICPKIDG